jgi:hypothetical protein
MLVAGQPRETVPVLLTCNLPNQGPIVTRTLGASVKMNYKSGLRVLSLRYHTRPICIAPITSKMVMSTLRYPDVARKEHQDTYSSKKQGSVVVSDHYRWLEGKGPEVDSFVQRACPPSLTRSKLMAFLPPQSKST